MKTDNELFELCKEVYEKTEWGKPTDEELTDVEFYYAQDGEIYHIASWNHEPFSVPLYTSDYLLEKLPPTIVARGEAFSTATRIAATPKQLIGTEADTPLKALLKLTLALHEAGELV